MPSYQDTYCIYCINETTMKMQLNERKLYIGAQADPKRNYNRNAAERLISFLTADLFLEHGDRQLRGLK